jgi:ATP-binding cassette subfamily B protein
LSGLAPFLRPYRTQIVSRWCSWSWRRRPPWCFPIALRSLIDGGLVNPDKGAQTMALREHFVRPVRGRGGAGAVLGWPASTPAAGSASGVTADLRNAVYAHVLRQSPVFFETTPDRRGAVAADG